MTEETRILPSARRHGISDEDMRHAVAMRVARFDDGDGMVMFIGAARPGTPLLEVGMIALRSGSLGIVHAMVARHKYLDRIGR